jgi:hypothetical protein
MLIFVASLVFSGLQIVVLLGLVKILGVIEYSSFSLYFSIATFISALMSEWARMIVVRFSDVRGQRTRLMVLRTSLVWIVGTAIVVLSAGVAGAAATWSGMIPIPASEIFAIGVLGASGIIGDCCAAFARFNLAAKRYISFLALRMATSGAAAASAAWITRSAAWTAIAFGGGVMIASILLVIPYWYRLSRTNDHRRFRRFLPVGAAMATSAIATNGVFALARIALRGAIPANFAGSLFLAMDLATRGVVVLGIALNTFSAKAVYRASHSRDEAELVRQASRASTLFSVVWLAAGVTGSGVALAVPQVFAHGDAYGPYGTVAVTNILAILLFSGRIFNLDLILNAARFYRVVVIASVLSLATLCIAALKVAVLALPLAIVASISFELVMVFHSRYFPAMARDMFVVGFSATCTLLLTQHAFSNAHQLVSWLQLGAVVTTNLMVAGLLAWRAGLIPSLRRGRSIQPIRS